MHRLVAGLPLGQVEGFVGLRHEVFCGQCIGGALGGGDTDADGQHPFGHSRVRDGGLFNTAANAFGQRHRLRWWQRAPLM